MEWGVVVVVGVARPKSEVSISLLYFAMKSTGGMDRDTPPGCLVDSFKTVEPPGSDLRGCENEEQCLKHDDKVKSFPG